MGDYKIKLRAGWLAFIYGSRTMDLHLWYLVYFLRGADWCFGEFSDNENSENKRLPPI